MEEAVAPMKIYGMSPLEGAEVVMEALLVLDEDTAVASGVVAMEGGVEEAAAVAVSREGTDAVDTLVVVVQVACSVFRPPFRHSL